VDDTASDRHALVEVEAVEAGISPDNSELAGHTEAGHTEADLCLVAFLHYLMESTWAPVTVYMDQIDRSPVLGSGIGIAADSIAHSGVGSQRLGYTCPLAELGGELHHLLTHGRKLACAER
jgi:hypothetical protein